LDVHTPGGVINSSASPPHATDTRTPDGSSDAPSSNAPTPAPAHSDAPNPLRSVYTSNLPEIMAQFGITLAVSTHQAGKVILVRNDNGVINTHFRNFHKPMGIATDAGARRLTIGGANPVLSITRLHARDRLPGAAGLHWPVSGAGDGGLFRYPPGGTVGRAHLWCRTLR
jgi:hypothetical protein